jgi:hypothetical protein
MKTIGKAEIAKIHIWKQRLGMDEESYRALLGGFGVESSTELSYARYRDIKIVFEKLLNAAGMATDAQLIKIRDLAKGTVNNLPGFCGKIVSRTVKSPGDLKTHEARKVIEALKRYHRASAPLGNRTDTMSTSAKQNAGERKSKCPEE